MIRILAAAALTLLFAFRAEAAPVHTGQSRIEFVSKQMGVPVKGAFKRFEADIEFETDDAGKSRASIIIHLDSIDAGSDEATTEIKRKPWFDVKNHPRAQFASSSLAALGNNRYRASGKMTVKGRTRDVSSDFTVNAVKGFTVFDGSFLLNRLDFAIGEGAWSDTDTVANEVQVVYRFFVPVANASNK